MQWWQSVEFALENLGGVAPLKKIYDEVRKVRQASGDTTPVSLEEVVRKELEYNSSDSSNWHKRRDLFFSVHGIGRGIWGLRSAIKTEPPASDLAPPSEIEGAVLAKEVTTNRIIRDTVMTCKVKALHHSKCQICGTSISLPDGRAYSEAHHIIPLGAPHRGPDIPSNIIIVCPNHHAMLDLGCMCLMSSAITAVDGHDISLQSIAYHNDVIVPTAKAPA
ncbi:HNH endonuclease [Rhizobium rhizogenes]|uniref:HNH nuclease domain-containing protein n=1 Tax=Rhizobium rhizogenes (strain K84 / ATCC BAA-868) TaxID=311403 RepID=B9JB56_RHIR8|nr:conserved hypothetical protein [Rhizobium rhizogenes K84]